MDLTTDENQLNFISSANNLIDLYGFDGIDVDIEHGNSILVTSGTIASPDNEAQVHLIEAIRQIMVNHRATHGEKMMLTFAPETAYVQGGGRPLSAAFGEATCPSLTPCVTRWTPFMSNCTIAVPCWGWMGPHTNKALPTSSFP